MKIIICKCQDKCQCIKDAKSHPGSKVIKDGKIVFPKNKSKSQMKTYNQESSLTRRDFMFPTEKSPSILNFQYFAGFYLNQSITTFDQPKNQQQLDEYLLTHHNIHHNTEKSNIWYVYLPTKIDNFYLIPHSYLNPSTDPPNSLSSLKEDHDFSILVEAPKTNFSLEQTVREIAQDEIRKIQATN